MTSSFCGSTECVKVRFAGDGAVHVSSTTDHRVLRYTAEEWKAFVLGAKAGEFDF